MFPKITITLDRERELRLDFNAMSEFENVTGHSLFTIGEKMQEARNIRAFLYATLKAAKNELTIEEVGSMMTMHNFKDIEKVMNQLMEASYGKQDDSDDKKK